MADFNNGYPDVITLQGRELFLLVDPLFNNGVNITVENFVEQYGVNEISDVPGLVADLAAKQTEININTTKLSTIEEGADKTDQANVFSALAISSAGSRDKYLSEQGTFEIAGSGTGDVTKAAVDAAIGVFPTGDSAQFYNEQGNFIDAVYDSIEDTPIIRNATIEAITIAGTRTNVQVQNTGTNEFSTVTILDSFNPVPTQYTTTFTSPNTTFTPALTFPAGSQGRQLSLTELDGTVHRFCYLVNGNYRYLDGGLSGTVRVGPVAVATTATVTAAVTVPDQTDNQTITLTGDETGTFAVGDFISPQANNFGAFRGIFVDSIVFDGTNTVIVGPSNGATTFNTTSVLRNAGPATEIQGTLPTWSYTPDTAGLVYSSAITTREFTGSNLTEYIAEMVAAITALETGIVQFGGTTATTLGGEAASSFTFDLGTETNIDSTFAFAGGLNNMNTLVNTDGVPGVGQTVATTVTVIDPEATEIASQTFGVTDVNDNNVDSVGNFINDAINNNTEAPIDFVSEYASPVVTAVAQEAGNTNPFTIVINNNGATPANAGNLSTTSVQSGELINQIETLKVRTSSGNTLADISESSGEILFQAPVGFSAFGTGAILLGHNLPNELTMVSLPASSGVIFNASRLDRDFTLRKQTTGDAYKFDASADVTTIDSDTINFVANTITGLPDTTVTKAAVDTAIGSGTLTTDYYASDKTWKSIPSGGTATTVQGTSGQIGVNTVGNTATVSLDTAITDAITANTSKTGITTAQATAITNNTAKTGITTAQASAITANTSKVGITTAQANAITANTSKTGITTAQATAITNNTAKTGITTAQANAITANTAKVSNVNILPLNNTFTGVNTFNNAAGGIQASRITGIGDTATRLDFDGVDTATITAGGELMGTFDGDTGDVTFQGSGGVSLFGTGAILIGHNLPSDLTMVSTPSTGVVFNASRLDRDFEIRKQTTGTALSYNAGTDTLDLGAANITGVADSETGTWSPSISNAGTLGTPEATYTRAGKNVICHCNVTAATGTSTSNMFVGASSLPFPIAPAAANASIGTWFTSTNFSPTTNATSGVVSTSGNLFFSNDALGRTINSTELRGFLGFTITYQTT